MKKYIKKSLKKQNGMSVIQVIAGITISAFLLTWTVKTWIAPANKKSEMFVASGEVASIITGAQDWVQGRTTRFTGISMTLLTDDEWTLKELGDGVGKNPWGGNYTASSADGSVLLVTVTGVPDALCKQMEAKSPQATCSANVVTYTIS